MQKETLTAYRCNFYSMKNKPVSLDNHLATNDDKTIANFGFKEMFEEYENPENIRKIDKQTGKLISISINELKTEDIEDGNKYYLIPKTGKYGTETTLIDYKKMTEEVLDPSITATYPHYIFFYETVNEKIVIFHRKGGSGCKCVLHNSINEILNKKGIRMELNVIVPENNSNDEFKPNKIKIKCVKKNKYSDPADALYDKKQKKVLTKEVVLYFKNHANSSILQSIIDRFSGNNLSDNLNVVELAQVNEDIEEVDEAFVFGKIGNAPVKFNLYQLENSIGELDITDKLKIIPDLSYMEKLSLLCDEYYMNIGKI